MAPACAGPVGVTCLRPLTRAHAGSRTLPRMPLPNLPPEGTPYRSVCGAQPLSCGTRLRTAPPAWHHGHATQPWWRTAPPCRHAWSTHRAVQQPVLREVRAHHVLAHARVHVMPRHAVLQGPCAMRSAGQRRVVLGGRGSLHGHLRRCRHAASPAPPASMCMRKEGCWHMCSTALFGSCRLLQTRKRGVLLPPASGAQDCVPSMPVALVMTCHHAHQQVAVKHELLDVNRGETLHWANCGIGICLPILQRHALQHRGYSM